MTASSILLVDDDPLQHAVIGRALTRIKGASFALASAHGFEEGLARMAEGGHAAYLIDYKLDTGDGIALVREARRRGCDGPFIIVTALTDAHADLTALQAGADDYLLKKHIDAFTLGKAIRYAIERHRARQVILEQQAKLAQSLRLSALGEMAGGIAHEINNPLTILLGRADQLRRLVAAPELDRGEALAAIDKIGGTVGRITRIVRTLRGLCRNEAAADAEAAPVRDLVLDALELCQGKLRQRDVRLEIGDIDPLLAVTCRPWEIQQVLMNLLSNAIEAVDLESDGPTSRWIRLTVDTTDRHVEIGLEDGGGGIPKAVRERIMEPFFTTKRDGTGLGLCISQKIVERHAGYLKLDEAAAHTRFVVGLPRHGSLARPVS